METVALITGASSGLGYFLTKEFYRNGISVALIARNGEKLFEKIDEEFAKSSGKYRFGS